MKITRRVFLRATGAAALTLSLGRLAPAAAAGEESGQRRDLPPYSPLPDYRGWEDLYRQRWSWDYVAKGTHYVNCWYQRGCNWNIYVKDGVVFREEQVASYPQTNASVPDFNPRGCQKGACYSHRMYGADRLKYPLKRAGESGEGKWRRVRWDEALDELGAASRGVLRQGGRGAG